MRHREAEHTKVSWNALWRGRKRSYVYRNVVKIAREALRGLKDRKILEVGCGRGETVLEMGRQGAQVTGVDYSEEAIRRCRESARLSQIPVHGDFVMADAYRLPFEERSFDFVFSVGLLEHFRDPDAILAEQFRVLKSGGFCLIQVPQKYSVYTIVKKILISAGKWPYGGWETQFSDSELCSLAEKAGLIPSYVTGYGSFVLALLRHSVVPNLDFGMLWRNGTELDVVRAVKAKTALDICVLARKHCDPSGTPDARFQVEKASR